MTRPMLSLSANLLSTAVRAWPFANGQGRIIDRTMRYVLFPAGRVTCPTIDGFSMDVLGHDLVGRHLILSGAFDSSGARQLLRFAQDGDIVLDIGANIGYVSCLLLASVPNSRVVAIEPNPEIIPLLRHNVSQFGRRAQVVEAALSNATGTATLNLEPGNMGASSLHGPATEKRGVEVATLSAADFLRTIPKLDLIKMDVEGHEEVIFNASLEALDRLVPKAILFEDPDARCSPEGPIGRSLASIGYTVLGVQKTLFKTQLVSVACMADCTYNDYIALPTRRSEAKTPADTHGKMSLGS